MKKFRQILKKVNDFLAGLPMTIVGGVFLLASFLLPRINNPSITNLIHVHYYYRGRVVDAGMDVWENLAWVTIIICGIPMLYLAIWRVIHNKGISKISSALLISIAMIACIYIGDYFAAGEVAFIMALGAILEDMTTKRARKGLSKLISLTPREGRRVVDGGEETIPLEQIRIGDTLRVLPGETIPVDGVVIAGETSVDQSIMTGESLPVDKAVGDEVFCGTVNRFGAIDLTASKVGEDSSLQRLIRMVEEADRQQAPVQRIADRWASWLVPVAMLIAIAAYLITGELDRMVTVLVVFCPCALVLATPTAIMAAIGQATKHGVIIKSGEALERLGGIRQIAFDKTGTLTEGKLTVTDVAPWGAIDENELLRLAGAVEARSEHPLGKAVTEYAVGRGLTLDTITDFAMSAGRGVSARISGRLLRCGSEAYLKEQGVALSAEQEHCLEKLRDEGKATVLVAEENRALGVIALADTMREQTPEVLRKLAEMKVSTVLLTGDHERAARWFAGRAGMSETHADLLPEDKVRMLQELKRKGPVCMIGDGVNDAPALKTADVGVALGCMGSDIAVEAADVALMTDDLTRIPYLKWLSNATVGTIRFSISLSMCINAAAVTLSVLGMLSPTAGALVHNCGSTFVVLIAALLYDRKYKG